MRSLVAAVVTLVVGWVIAVEAGAAQGRAAASAQERTAASVQERAGAGAPDRSIVVGSKRFTESYVLGELLRLQLARNGVRAEHRAGLGNTAILHQALVAGAIDLYPEYTGTIAREILGRSDDPSLAVLNEALAAQGLAVSTALGFSNSYALGVAPAFAERSGVRTISELAKLVTAPRVALSHEFLGRADGWRALARTYGLPFTPTGLDHGLAYEALAAGRIDLTDVYTTDAKIARYRLRVLEDDRRVFPRYDAVVFHRRDLDARVVAALAPLAGTIDEGRMIALNAAVEIDGRTFAAAAERYFTPDAQNAPSGVDASQGARTFSGLFTGRDFLRLTREHLVLVFASLGMALALGVPLGVAAAKHPRFGALVMGAVGVVQTIPSLALLALLVAALGAIGIVPALVALGLYALLPIVANTFAGLTGVPRGLVAAGTALGLTPAQVLRTIELPIALPTLLVGVQTAAVINVGTATIAAFVGAGGYGERIAAGLALNDAAMLVGGAVPAALLALVLQAFFAWLVRRAGATRGRAR